MLGTATAPQLLADVPWDVIPAGLLSLRIIQGVALGRGLWAAW